MKQYLGGHNETWGGVTINIDSNFIDLGAGSQPRPEGRCPGTRLGFWKYPALSPSSAKSTRVKALQCLLTEQGTYSGPVNGSYDAATIAGARAWQSARKFTPSNTFEKRHWTALLAAGARTTVKRGSADESVHRLQRALNAAGAGRFRATGVFDAKTEAAVRTYQSRLKIGVSGVATAPDLEQAAAGSLTLGASRQAGGPTTSATPVRPATATQADERTLGRAADQPAGEPLEEAVRSLGAQAPGVAQQPGALGVPLEGHRRERRHRSTEAQRQPADGPLLVDEQEHGHQAVGDEHDAVDHAEDLDAELGGLGDVLEEHARQQQRPGDGLGDGDGAVERVGDSCEGLLGEGGEEAEPVGAGTGEVLDRVLGVRHQADDVAALVGDAGDVAERAVGVVVEVARDDAALALEHVERVGSSATKPPSPFFSTIVTSAPSA